MSNTKRFSVLSISSSSSTLVPEVDIALSATTYLECRRFLGNVWSESNDISRTALSATGGPYKLGILLCREHGASVQWIITPA